MSWNETKSLKCQPASEPLSKRQKEKEKETKKVRFPCLSEYMHNSSVTQLSWNCRCGGICTEQASFLHNYFVRSSQLIRFSRFIFDVQTCGCCGRLSKTPPPRTRPLNLSKTSPPQPIPSAPPPPRLPDLTATTRAMFVTGKQLLSTPCHLSFPPPRLLPCFS